MMTLPALVPMASCWYSLDHEQKLVSCVIFDASLSGAVGAPPLDVPDGGTSQRKIATPSCKGGEPDRVDE